MKQIERERERERERGFSLTRVRGHTSIQQGVISPISSIKAYDGVGKCDSVVKVPFTNRVRAECIYFEPSQVWITQSKPITPTQIVLETSATNEYC